MLLSNAMAQDEPGYMAEFRTWAATPPMGWNSWDCYYSSVTEKEVMQNAQYLVDNDLVKYGWEYVVIDIRWYCNHPSLGGGNYNQKGTQDYVLDEYGRYLPSPSRFPSCMQDGKNIGFKAIADQLHAMGLKFGIHIMRGVPKSVVGSSYKLKGSEGTAWSQVYNGTTSPCTWLKDNLLVRNNGAGQLYYNSIMDLYAEWGVDFLKVDDLSRPFYTDEIHMIRKAIDQTGRPMALSLSPGKTQYQYADECLENANMWRMMDDLWDNWSAVDAVFNEAHAWETVTRKCRRWPMDKPDAERAADDDDALGNLSLPPVLRRRDDQERCLHFVAPEQRGVSPDAQIRYECPSSAERRGQRPRRVDQRRPCHGQSLSGTFPARQHPLDRRQQSAV